LQTLLVVGWSEVRNQLIAELPAAIRQVLAWRDGGEKRDSGLHDDGASSVYEHLLPLTI